MQLVPALKIGSKVYVGDERDSHNTIAVKHDQLAPESSRGFSPDNGKTFLTRLQAVGWLKKYERATFRKLPGATHYRGLHSEDLATARGIKQYPPAQEMSKDGTNIGKPDRPVEETPEKVDLSEKTAIVFERGGLYTYTAEKLAQKYKKVKYFVAEADAFPTSQKAKIGDGLKNVERIDNFWDHVDTCDIIYFFDVYDQDLQHYLRSKGYTVFGCGKGGSVETDKIGFLEHLEDLKLPCAKTYLAEGVTDLIGYLEKHDGETLYLKNIYRGDFESRKFTSMAQIKPFIADLKSRLGASCDTMQVLVQHKIESECEAGIDTFNVDGEYAKNGLIGIEVKDTLFLAKVFKEYPPILDDINQAFSPIFKKLGYRSNYSTEIRITKDGIPYYIDATCVSDDTEILTDRGWKLFQDLDRTESVATLDVTTREIVYQKPLAYQEFDYSGRMISISNRSKSLDLLVTPDHGIYASHRSPDAPLQYFTADTLKGKLSIPRTGNWTGFSPEFFELPSYHKEWVGGRWGNTHRVHHNDSVLIPFKVWLRFMALYLSEGSCFKHGVSITQYDKLGLVEEIMSALPFTVARTASGFQISSIQLRAYVKQFGISYDKYIPDYIMNASSEDIELFLNTFVEFDGSIRRDGRNEGRKFFSTSKRMIDQIQELLLKTGCVGNIGCNDAEGTVCTVNGKSYTRRSNLYWVADRPKYKTFWMDASSRRALYINDVEYTGKVYDVTVPNGTIYIRRNGKPAWTSNCRQPEPPGALMCEIYDNWAEATYSIAAGILPELQPKAKYGAEIILSSLWYKDDHELHIKFPSKYKENIKLSNVCVQDGEYYCIPGDTDGYFGSVVAWGDSIDEVIAKATEIAESIEADGLKFSPEAFEEAKKSIAAGEKFGIDFK